MNSPAFEGQQRQNIKPDIPLSLLLLDATFPSVCIETWLNSHHILELWGIMMRNQWNWVFFFTFPGATPWFSQISQQRHVEARSDFASLPASGEWRSSRCFCPQKDGEKVDFAWFYPWFSNWVLPRSIFLRVAGPTTKIWKVVFGHLVKRIGISAVHETTPNCCDWSANCGQGQIFVRVHWFKLFFLYRSRNWQAQTIRWGFGFATASYSRKEAKTAGRGDGLWLVVARKLRKGNGCVRK